MIGQIYQKPPPHAYGYELSYPQTHSLVHYLIDMYSFADAVKLLSISDFEYEGVFGKSYEEMKLDWIAWFQQRYDYYYAWEEQMQPALLLGG